MKDRRQRRGALLVGLSGIFRSIGPTGYNTMAFSDRELLGVAHLRPGPGGGMFVAKPSSRVRLNHLVLGFKVDDAPFTDCLAVRNALEPLVCREASEHCKAADAKALRAIVAGMQKQTDKPKAFLRLNWDLHRRMAKMGSNAPLKTLYLTLLVEAVIDGNPKRLAKAIERHTPMADRWITGNGA